ncbi:unnamed protein product [Phyllotreta striolata]|uniref:Uncharacterized protein n=1 Tax=Phyllotreta striolata TaxID=444603 RepID=A0A9N9TR35_PHYSR|nr:unnamed protein product [Phyllotreta striolata]
MTTNRANFQRCACSSTPKTRRNPTYPRKPAKTQIETLLDCQDCCKRNKNITLPEFHLHCNEDPDCTINALKLNILSNRRRRKNPQDSRPSKKYHYLMTDKSTNVPKKVLQHDSFTTVLNVKTHNAQIKTTNRPSKDKEIPRQDVEAALDDSASSSSASVDTINTYFLAPHRRSERRSKLSTRQATKTNGRVIAWKENLSGRSTLIGGKRSAVTSPSDFLFVLREVIKMDNQFRSEKGPETRQSGTQTGRIYRWFGWFKLFRRKKRPSESKSPKDVSLYDYDDDDF